jgi:hypothetical protein
MAGAEYNVLLKSTSGVQIGVINDYLTLEYSRAVNGMGLAHVFLPYTKYPSNIFPTDGIIEIWRKPLGFLPYLEGDTIWYIREPKLTLSSSGVYGWEIYAEDAISLLYRRIHQLDPYTTKKGASDDVMKSFVRDDLLNRTDAITKPYNLGAYLTVQADMSQAPYIEKEAHYRNILTTLQEIDQFAFTNGTYLAFDIVSKVPATGISLEFRTYIGQRGIDRRWGYSNNPVILDPQANTITQFERAWDSFGMANLVVAGGIGTGNARIIATSIDSDSINLSPFNLCEKFADASNGKTFAEVDTVADDKIREYRTKRTLSAQAMDTPYMVYGGHYKFGDYLTCKIMDELINVRFDAYAIKAEKGKENITVMLRSDE